MRLFLTLRGYVNLDLASLLMCNGYVVEGQFGKGLLAQRDAKRSRRSHAVPYLAGLLTKRLAKTTCQIRCPDTIPASFRSGTASLVRRNSIRICGVRVEGGAIQCFCHAVQVEKYADPVGANFWRRSDWQDWAGETRQERLLPDGIQFQ